MINPFTQIRRSLSVRIGLLIVFFAVSIFVVSLGFVYVMSREYVREDAMRRASQVLNNTVLRVTEILDEVEIATNNTNWLVRTHLQPDSVRIYSRRIIEMNPNFKGCSISFEPNFFKEEGKYFSVYSSRVDGVVQTEQEGNDEYRYYNMDWYTMPKRENKPCWVDPFFDDTEEDGTIKDEMITSYAVPLINSGGQCIGVIATDLSLSWLSQTISAGHLSDNELMQTSPVYRDIYDSQLREEAIA
jgi:sigma-B regulation protein RsbU (phosphoserine phosphatase)